MTDSERGCAQSHVNVWKMIADKNYCIDTLDNLEGLMHSYRRSGLSSLRLYHRNRKNGF